MAVTVKQLYKNGKFLYKMDLIAGKEGMNNLVQWVHIIEDDNVSSFLHGNELVFTAGILNREPLWLLGFAQKLYAAGTSAFVVNLGPHTKFVPQEVVDYCDKHGMALFTIPWETKMVDMTRDFCRRIIRNEQGEQSAASVLMDILFNVGDVGGHVLQMERYGYQRNSSYCFVCVELEGPGISEAEEQKDALWMAAEKAGKSMHELFLSFSYKESRVFVLADYAAEEIETFVDALLKKHGGRENYEIHIGVSANVHGIYEQGANFERGLSALDMAKKHRDAVVYYDQMGIYKLLYAVKDESVLRSFYKNTIGKLEQYDRENETQLTAVLADYFEGNGSLQYVVEKQFVHRNTVSNQLKKIHAVTGYNPLVSRDKIVLGIGMVIKGIL